MSSFTLAAIVFACVFGGALLGLFLRNVLPEHHVREDTKDVMKLTTGLIATLAALVLGLLVASAKSSFDTMNDDLRQIGAKLIVLDRTLARYGPETADLRQLVRGAFTARVEFLFPADASQRPTLVAPIGAARPGDIEEALLALVPRTDAQRWLQSRALQVNGDIEQTRWLALEQAGATISIPFLVVLVFWLAAIFASFGLFAPRNATAIVVLVVGALAVSTSIFLIDEMDHPLDGVISLSSGPMRNALAELGQ